MSQKVLAWLTKYGRQGFLWPKGGAYYVLFQTLPSPDTKVRVHLPLSKGRSFLIVFYRILANNIKLLFKIFRLFFGIWLIKCLVSFPKNKWRNLRLDLVPPLVGWRSFDTGFTKWNEVKIPTEKCIFFGSVSLYKQRNEQNKINHIEPRLPEWQDPGRQWKTNISNTLERSLSWAPWLRSAQAMSKGSAWLTQCDNP